MALEHYVRNAVAGELAVGSLGPAIADRMLALQAIVARTWVVAHLGRHAREGFDVCTTTHCQLLRADADILPANRPRLDAAVAATRGQVLLYHGRPIEALFHADCGGATRSPRDVWGTHPRPYLQPVRDAGCLRNPSSAWQFAAPRDTVRLALNRSPRTAVGARLDAIRILDRDEAGRGVLVALDGERSPVVRGEELRATLTREFGYTTVKSPGLEVTRDGDRLVFSGHGFGHGVGLCQRGAMRRLADGASVAEVLRAYYTGTSVATVPIATIASDAGRESSSRGR